MTTPFRVDLEELDALVARVTGLAGFIRDELDELDRRVDALHLESWSGTAASAHLDAHRHWAEAATDFVEHARRHR